MDYNTLNKNFTSSLNKYRNMTNEQKESKEGVELFESLRQMNDQLKAIELLLSFRSIPSGNYLNQLT